MAPFQSGRVIVSFFYFYLLCLLSMMRNVHYGFRYSLLYSFCRLTGKESIVSEKKKGEK